MIPKLIPCPQCSAEIEIRTYRTFSKCKYCSGRIPFIGFEYRDIDWDSSMYAGEKLWMDCPACMSPNMFLGPSGWIWKCTDCGYTISRILKTTSVFWFCDSCETYLNVQPNFTTKKKTWTCTECGHENDVTGKNIL